MKFDQNNCICNEDEKLKYLFNALDYNTKSVNKSAIINICSECKSITPSIFPQLDFIKQAYPKNYYTKNDVKTGKLIIILKKLFKLLRGKKYLYRTIPNTAKTILDYGCGSGKNLEEVNKHFKNIRLIGTDIHPLSKKCELNNFEFYRIEELQSMDITYDWITLGHVIEHLRDPIECLISLNKNTNKAGGIWISTPNSESFIIQCFGEYARDIDFPRHRIIFSRRLLKDILKQVGYKDITFLNSPKINSILCFMQSTKNLIKSDNASIFVKMKVMINSSYNLIKYIIAFKKYSLLKSAELIVRAKTE